MRVLAYALCVSCLSILAAPVSAQRLDGADVLRGIIGIGIEMERRRQLETRRQNPPAPSTAPPIQTGSGLSRNQLRDVQQSLADLGYDPGVIDGLMGPRTRGAIMAFQRAYGLAQSGAPDVATRAALETATRAQRASTTEHAASVISPDERAEAQRLLALLGYDPGEPDGVMTPRLEQALDAFQIDRGLPRSGVPDAATMAALHSLARPVPPSAVPPQPSPPQPVPSDLAAAEDGGAVYLVRHQSGRTDSWMAVAVCMERDEAERILAATQSNGRTWTLMPQTLRPNYESVSGIVYDSVLGVVSEECLEPLINTYTNLEASRGADRNDLIVIPLTAAGAADALRRVLADPTTPPQPPQAIPMSNPEAEIDGETLYLVRRVPGRSQPVATAFCTSPEVALRALDSTQGEAGPWTVRQDSESISDTRAVLYSLGFSAVVTEACLEGFIETYTSAAASVSATLDLSVTPLIAGAAVTQTQGLTNRVMHPQTPAPNPASLASLDGLIEIGGRPVLLTGAAVPIATRSLQPNSERLATALHYMALLQGHGDDLSVLPPDALTTNDQIRLFRRLPAEARQRLMALSLELQAADERRRASCAASFDQGARNFAPDCVFTSRLSVFDQRRLAQELVTEVARAAEAWRGVGPIEVHVACAVTARRLTDSYSFGSGALDWGHFLSNHNGCRPQWMDGMSAARANHMSEIRLPAMLPSTTPLSAEEAEALETRLETATRGHALMFTFPARIEINVQGGGAAPLERVTYRIEPIGPIDLRQPQIPDEVVLVLTAPGAMATLDVDFDLAEGRDLSSLAALARPLDEIAAPAFSRAFMEAEDAADAPTLRLRAGAISDPQARNRLRFQLARLPRSRNADVSAHIAAALRVPSSHVGLVFEDSSGRPLYAVSARPLDAVTSQVDLGDDARSEAEPWLVAALEHVVVLDFAGNEALVAFVDPREFVLTRRVNREILARIPLAAAPRQAPQQIFVPPPIWYALRDARLHAEDPQHALETLVSRHGLGSATSIARQAVIESALARAESLDQAYGEDDIWIGGTLRLGPYDQTGQMYSISTMSLAVPLAGPVDQAISSQMMPSLPMSARVVPIPAEIAQARQDEIGEGRTYVFRARIGLHERFRNDTRSPRAEILELSLVRLHGSGSVVVDTGFAPEDALYSAVYAPSVVEVEVATPDGGAWDILGVRLDMSIDAAESALIASLRADPTLRLRLSPEMIMAGSGGDLNSPYRNGRFLAFGENEGVTLFNEPPTGSNDLVAVSRTRSYPQGSRPAAATLIQALREKYGNPTTEVDGGLIWLVQRDPERMSFDERLALSGCVRLTSAAVGQLRVFSNIRLRRLDRGRQPWEKDSNQRITHQLVDDEGAPVDAPLGAATLLAGKVSSGEAGCGPDDIVIAMLLPDPEGLVRQLDMILLNPMKAQDQSDANALARQGETPGEDSGEPFRLDL